MNYQNLEQNIIDVIKEEQAKLGYRLEEIRLYYPLSSVNHLLNTTGSAEKTLQSLADFGVFTADRLGVVTASCRKERFCFYIPEQGSRYVHEHTQPDEFIGELVALVGKHGTTLEQIRELFRSRQPEAHMEVMDGDEFDLLIYFEQPFPDPYYYCFKNEGLHVIYHRFLPSDYKDFSFE